MESKNVLKKAKVFMMGIFRTPRDASFEIFKYSGVLYSDLSKSPYSIVRSRSGRYLVLIDNP